MSAGTRWAARTREEMPTDEEKAIHDYIKKTLLLGIGEKDKKVSTVHGCSRQILGFYRRALTDVTGQSGFLKR